MAQSAMRNCPRDGCDQEQHLEEAGRHHQMDNSERRPWAEPE